jgi:hypothetical protein
VIVQNDADGKPEMIYVTEEEWAQIKGWSVASAEGMIRRWGGVPVLVVPDDTFLAARMKLSHRIDTLWREILEAGRHAWWFKWLVRLLRRSR